MFMKCPNDQSDLLMTERQGIEIDYCPRCRGVGLDRGESDKIIERAATSLEQPASFTLPQPASGPPQHAQPPYGGPHHDPRYGHQSYDRRYKKKRSFLGEIFDFD
jgi:hypothetical protein